MSTIKISELPVITGANTAEADVLPIVDTSLSTTNKITRAEFFKNVPDMEINDKIIHAGDTNTSIRFPAADTVTVETSGTERLRIDSSGNVGIGVTAPASRLNVVGDQIVIAGGSTLASLGIQIKGTVLEALPAAQVQGYIATGNSAIGLAGDLLIAPRTSAATSVRFITGTTPAERMRIDGSGNVGIGTNSPPATFTVLGAANSAVARFTGTNTSRGLEIVTFNSGGNDSTGVSFNAISSGSQMTFGTANTERMRITSAGNVGIGTTAPNATLTISSSGANGLNLAADQANSLLSARLMLSNGTAGQSFVLTNNSGGLTFGTGGTPDFGSGTERMRITSAGNVGIGTSSPADLLHVSKNGDSIARVTSADGLGDAAVRFYSGATYKGQVGWDQSSDVLALYAPNDATVPALSVGIGAVIYKRQPAQSVESAAATLTIAELLTGIIQYTGALATLTMPTGTDIEGGVPATFPTNMSFDFSVINTGAGVVTLGTAAGLTLVGGMTVAAAASGLFRVRKTATNTYTIYRIS